MYNFQGDLTDISAKKEALVTTADTSQPVLLFSNLNVHTFLDTLIQKITVTNNETKRFSGWPYRYFGVKTTTVTNALTATLLVFANDQQCVRQLLCFKNQSVHYLAHIDPINIIIYHTFFNVLDGPTIHRGQNKNTGK